MYYELRLSMFKNKNITSTTAVNVTIFIIAAEHCLRQDPHDVTGQISLLCRNAHRVHSVWTTF